MPGSVCFPTGWCGAGRRLRLAGGRPGAGGGASVAAAGWASWAGVGGWRRAARKGDLRAEAAKPAPDPGRGEPVGWQGWIPGPTQIVGVAASESELGVCGDDQPGPAVPGSRVTDLRCGPAEGLFEQPEGVFQVEAAQERLPAAVHVCGCGAGG